VFTCVRLQVKLCRLLRKPVLMLNIDKTFLHSEVAVSVVGSGCTSG